VSSRNFYNSPVHRFYVPDLDPTAGRVTLPADESRHLVGVLRLTEGAEVAVFDGRGREFSARVTSVRRTGVGVALVAPRAPAREPAIAIALAPVVLKGDKMDEVVRDAVMAGAAAIHPLISARAEVSLAAVRRAERRARWQRIAVASAKQCGRAVVPPVETVRTFEEWVGADGDAPTGLVVALVEPSLAVGGTLASLPAAPRPTSAVLLVGPEGGWTPDEIARLSAREVRLVSLGSRTLRADAVPVVAISLLQFIWGDL